MKSYSVIFLQATVVLISIVTVIILLYFPLMEGRARDLDLLSIYLDPFILYGYAASIPFFVAMKKVFKLLGYIKQNEIYSFNLLITIKEIKHCFIVLSILIVLAGIYIFIFHPKDDDPVGFLAMYFLTTFISLVVAMSVSLCASKNSF